MSLKKHLARYGNNVEGNAGLRAYANERSENVRTGGRPAGSELPTRKNLTTAQYVAGVGEGAAAAARHGRSVGKRFFPPGTDPAVIARAEINMDARAGAGALARRAGATAVAGVLAYGIQDGVRHPVGEHAPQQPGITTEVGQFTADTQQQSAKEPKLPSPTDIPPLPPLGK